MEPVMMKCGHTAMGITTKGKPVCVICCGLTPNAEIPADAPNLDGRKAKCTECNNTAPSKLGLPFFGAKPSQEYDEFYCGCRGWD